MSRKLHASLCPVPVCDLSPDLRVSVSSFPSPFPHPRVAASPRLRVTLSLPARRRPK